MDLNIEGVGEVSGWEPAIDAVLSQGFKATMNSLKETFYHGGLHCEQSVELTRKFIDSLEQKGYCIAKYTGE